MSNNYFTSLAKRLGLHIEQLLTLNRLAKKAAKSQEREQNTGLSPDSFDEFEEYAKRLGFNTIWPGLYPLLVRDNGEQIFIEWE
jgi:hypothetical protein